MKDNEQSSDVSSGRDPKTRPGGDPPWAWWAASPGAVRLGHAVPILRKGRSLEEVVFRGGAPLDRALQAHQRANPSMGRNDRLLLGTAVYALARSRETLRLALPDAAVGEGDLLLLALLDATLERSGPPPVELPGGATRWMSARAALGAAREQFARLLEREAEVSVERLSAQARAAFSALFSLPEWWLVRGPWLTLGAATHELALLKQPQKLCLRVQAHRQTRDAVRAELEQQGISSRPTFRSPWGLVVEGRHNVLATDLYRNGTVEVQDEGSQLVASLCDPRPNERVLDLCAGAGGKALALGAAMGGRGSIVAHDSSEGRLLQTKKRARRAGLGNIRTVGERNEVERLGPYDLVLVDAPCSSSGTLRRNPDVAWRWDTEGLAQLTRLQAEILEGASSLVAPGGTLVYVTCSLLCPENDEQIQPFLDRHPEFFLHPPGDRRGHSALMSVPGACDGAFRLAANLRDYDGDAFFLARFARRR